MTTFQNIIWKNCSQSGASSCQNFHLGGCTAPRCLLQLRGCCRVFGCSAPAVLRQKKVRHNQSSSQKDCKNTNKYFVYTAYRSKLVYGHEMYLPNTNFKTLKLSNPACIRTKRMTKIFHPSYLASTGQQYTQ